MNRYATLLALNLLAGAMPVLASEVPTSWQAVDDDVLAQATGKYLDQNMIAGFQLVLQSQWQTPSGANLIASGAIDVQKAGNGYQVGTSGATGVTPALTNVLPSANNMVSSALATINGVAQITQVAGNGNAATNFASIDFSPVAHLVPTGGTGGATSSSTSLGGSTAQVAINAAGVNLNLSTPFGNVSQSVAGGAGGAANRLMQLVQVTGNNQQVLNTLNLHLQTSPITADALRQIGIQSALANMLPARR
ncbi:hypothetical protein PTE30175_01949 [Pandoraea terrae]|uniref:Peptidase C39 n=1 Tax=Pandoraea terrae TaxID=1537710 RepID=A0A5E4UFF1_9BURK|nr:peptidase C39 [Pandoraea terrae]VVD98786.1 hypothetical protein PTE30175_01949 [Pandoraea terrae]